MFARWPGENVGLKTGKASGTVIIDLDPRNGGMETLRRLQAEHGYLPPTRLHATGGGGFHYVLGYPEGVKELPSRTIGPGVEVKAELDQAIRRHLDGAVLEEDREAEVAARRNIARALPAAEG
jgi:hypothetical protein